MSKTIERRQEIIHLIKQQGKVDIEQLSQKFQTSAVTIRSDLNALDKKGLLIRTRGGAMVNNRLTQELSVNEKHSKHHKVKQRIAKFAANLVEDGDALLLDSGTTTEEISRHLKHKKDLIVMTNGLNIANELADTESTQVLLTGGTLRKKSQSFYGRSAEEQLKDLRFDKLFLGVDGFDLHTGITTHFELEATLNRVMCNISREVIAVTDSSKFNQRGFHIICASAQISRLITDKDIPQNYLQALEKEGVIVDLV